MWWCIIERMDPQNNTELFLFTGKTNCDSRALVSMLVSFIESTDSFAMFRTIFQILEKLRMCLSVKREKRNACSRKTFNQSWTFCMWPLSIFSLTHHSRPPADRTVQGFWTLLEWFSCKKEPSFFNRLSLFSFFYHQYSLSGARWTTPWTIQARFCIFFFFTNTEQTWSGSYIKTIVPNSFSLLYSWHTSLGWSTSNYFNSSK